MRAYFCKTKPVALGETATRTRFVFAAGASSSLSSSSRSTQQNGQAQGRSFSTNPTSMGRRISMQAPSLNVNRSKVASVQDAVSLIRSKDTVCLSGFVTQAIPEAVLRGIENRFLEEGTPNDMTLLFYGMGDPKGTRGTNHFKHPGMLKRVIGSHYGQSPELQPLIFDNQIEAYSLPMGSISRMVRAKAAGSPGHITRVGLGTFVDPRQEGGKLNKISTEDLVEVITIDNHEYLRFKPIPVDVAIIRATSADPSGNLSIEKESVSPDCYTIATCARASGGIVIAQVERIVSNGSMKMNDVKVPGALVDCVVPVDNPAQDHTMSFYTHYDPSWSGEIRRNLEGMPPIPLSIKKMMARRAAMELKVDDLVNLGIGAPELVANVANEEGFLQNITLTTEAGHIGGIGASGLDFGPATNSHSRVDIGQQFDMYNGGGLNICFLGAAEVDEKGNVNVSKLSETAITGPGGFIDISQSTHRVVFIGTFKKKGLKVEASHDHDGKPILKILNEGSISMFKKNVQQITFNADQARAHAQNVVFITERAVFKLHHKGLELVEVAPGIDIEKDILAHMDFEPIMNNVTEMDVRIFKTDPMKMKAEFYQDADSFDKRFHYNSETETVYIDLCGLTVRDRETLMQMGHAASVVLDELTDEGNKKIHAVTSFERSDVKPEFVDDLADTLDRMDQKYFLTNRRLAGKCFMRQKAFRDMNLMDNDMIWDHFTKDKVEKQLTRTEFKEQIERFFQLKLRSTEILSCLGDCEKVTEENFDEILEKVNECIETVGRIPIPKE